MPYRRGFSIHSKPYGLKRTHARRWMLDGPLGYTVAVWFIVACGTVTIAEPSANIRPAMLSQSILFPRQAPTRAPQIYPDARLVGQLVVVDTCLRIDVGQGHPSVLPVWPPNFTLSIENGTPTIMNEVGNVVGRVGDTLELRGGDIPDDENAWLTTEMLRQKPPQTCRGPYWLAADDVKRAS